MSQRLIPPHGGELVDLLVSGEKAEELRERSKGWPSWDLSERQLCDVELLLCGGFSPLRGFMGREDYEGVCGRMRLRDGTLWPMPVTLDVSEEVAKRIGPGSFLALRDGEGVMVAAMEVEEVWKADLREEAQAVYGTLSKEHPGVAYLLEKSHPYYAGGRLLGLELPLHYDFVSLRYTPARLREEFSRLGWQRVVAFQTRNPLHRAHYEMTLRAMKRTEAHLLLHPVVGMTKPGDVDHYTRVRCYRALLSHYPPHTTLLSLLPLAMRMAGPREALWHALIRKNYGCTHFIVGRDHAGPGVDSRGRPFYGPYEAQELFSRYEEEMGVRMVPFGQMVYVEELGQYMAEEEVPQGKRIVSLSGTELRERLIRGEELPEWFTFSEVERELRRSYPPRQKRGFVVFFTGLSGSGKSTLAQALLVRLLERGGRSVTLLDGDRVRKHLSSELGFSKEDRDRNIRRIGFVAAEVARAGGIALCAPIAPYEQVRREVREMVEGAGGGFILVYVATPLEECEKRDRKGLYAKARAGLIENFTGISDPYEEPRDAEVVVDTTGLRVEEAVGRIWYYLEREGYLGEEE